jgi:outer membrane protein insertion porin family
MRTRLFNDARITVQKEHPDLPGYRDVLVEVKERNTGAVNFGVAVGSDSGLFGEISVNQTNFDITDTPESLEELITGRAFRGGGQTFNASIRPGTELFQYSMSLTEPHLFDTDYSGTAGFLIFQRDFSDYTQEQIGGSLGFGRRLGDIWNAALRNSVKQVKLTDIDPSAPTEVFGDAGPSLLTGAGLQLTRTTIGTVTRPGSGSRLELGYDFTGAFGGDYSFSTINAEYTVYFTVAEDFLGRITTVKISSRAGYQFGGYSPTYERFYLGGRSFRGFDFRTISPKGIANNTGLPSDDPVGGTWLFFLGTQYEFPILADSITGVAFVDSGTVTDDPGFDEYRVSVGVGLRLYIPAFGQLPIALDFGFPLVKQESDEEQLFSFSAEFPF